MKVYNEPIPLMKFGEWHRILCATGGRYIYNPETVKDTVRVSYAPGNYTEMQRRWKLATMPIREKNSTGFWSRVRRKLMW